MARLSFVLLLIICTAGSVVARDGGLAVAHGPEGKPYITYMGEPIFAFGPADEARILGGAADLERWAEWQASNGMNLMRAYPTHIPMEVWGTPCEQQMFNKAEGSDLWDVDSFNDEYFEMLHDKLARLEEYGIIVHLQLWQIVFFKPGELNRWGANYLNPKNNINQWTRSFRLGNDYIDAPAGSRARDHQREWVLRVLDAAKGRGNVMIDVINELGNQMGTLDWAVEVVRWIREWEVENDWEFLVGVDSEHHYTPERFGPYRDHFDVIMLNELRSPDHAREAFDNFKMPVVSVRSSDGTNNFQRDYMFGNENQYGPEHQVRYRTLSYRSMFSNLQSVGCYWKMPVDLADYRNMELWPVYSRSLRSFWDMIKPYWSSLIVDDAIIVSGTVTPEAYGMRSPGLYLVYLECGPHTWNNSYPSSEIKLKAPDNLDTIEIFHPASGKTGNVKFENTGEVVRVNLPAFVDDIVIIMRTKKGTL